MKKYSLVTGLLVMVFFQGTYANNLENAFVTFKDKLTELERILSKSKPIVPGKKDITQNLLYKALDSMLNKNIQMDFTNEQLHKLLKDYQQLEQAIKDKKFTVTVMPRNIAGLDDDINGEVDRRSSWPGKKDIKLDSRYKALDAIENIRDITAEQLHKLLQEYQQLEQDVKAKKFIVGAMPGNIARIDEGIQQELTRRRLASGKSEINNDSNYKFLKDALSELQNISIVSLARLKQLLAAYNLLEEEVKKGQFKETAMPIDIAGIKAEIENEIGKRPTVRPRPPSPAKIDTSKMTDEQFEEFQEKIDDDISEYRKNLEDYTKEQLEALINKIKAWQADDRRADEKDVGFGQFLRKLDEEIKDRSRETPEQKVAKLAQTIINEIAQYNPNYKTWKKETKSVSRGKDPISGQPESKQVSVWSNQLIDLLKSISIYFNRAVAIKVTKNKQIEDFAKGTLLTNLDSAITQDEYQKILKDPQLESRVLYNDKDALKERIRWIKFIKDYQSVAKILSNPVPDSIVNLKKKISDDILESYRPIFDAAKEKVKRKALGANEGEEEFKKLLDKIQAYYDFLILADEQDNQEIYKLAPEVKKAFLKYTKNYFINTLKQVEEDMKLSSAQFNNKHSKQQLENLLNQIDLYMKRAEEWDIGPDEEIEEFPKKLEDYQKKQ